MLASPPSVWAQTVATVEVDAGAVSGPVRLLSGICCTAPDPAVPDAMIAPLRLPFWRMAHFGDYDRLLKLNPKIVRTSLLSDAFLGSTAESAFKTYLRDRGYSEAFIEEAWQMALLYHVNNNDPRVLEYLSKLTAQQKLDVTAAYNAALEAAKLRPWHDWVKWRTFVSNYVLQAKQAGKNIRHWEVLNEPDSTDFWPDITPELFLETYRVAHEAVKAADPAALVGGPSLAIYNRISMENFLAYVQARGLSVDFLVWHSLELAPGDVMDNIPGQVLEVRQILATRFPSLSVKEIHINEVIGPSNNYSPGAALGSFRFLESGGVDYSARAVWSFPDGRLLNGLLYDPLTPRPVWWAYKAYADTATGTRLVSGSSDPAIVSLASLDGGGGNYRVLLGHYSKRGDPSPTRSVTLRLTRLPFPAALVEVRKIPAQDGPMASEPPVVWKATVPVENGSVSLGPGLIAKDEVFVVNVSSSPGPPMLASVTPSTLTIGVPFAATFAGSGFQQGAALVYTGPGPSSGTTPLEFVSPTQLKASGTLGSEVPTGQYSVRIRNPDLQFSNTLPLWVILAPAPTLSSVTPESIRAGEIFTLTLKGLNFLNGAKLVVSGPASSEASTEYVSSTELRVSEALPTTTPTGTYTLKIKNPDNQVSAASVTLTVLPPGPPSALEVDFGLVGRDIRQVKEGYGVGEPNRYAAGLYAREIGYDGALIRQHDWQTLPYRNLGRLSEQIELVQKLGRPVVMLDLLGMPRDLSRYEAYDFDRWGCPKPWTTAPPKDWLAWKNYVRDMVRYVNLEKQYNIKYFEIWNEPTGAVPDARVGGGLLGCFWSGTEQEYYTLYQKTVEGIREAYAPNPVPADVKIGGPAAVSWNDRFQPQGEPLYVTLPRFARQNALPLDFFSWHQYSGNPGEIEVQQATATLRGALASFGFANAELILDEYEVSWPVKDWANHKRSVLLAGTFATLVNQGVDRQNMHALEDVAGNPSAAHGLFGGPGSLIAKPEFNLYKGISHLGDTLIPLASRPYPGSLYALATKSQDRVGLMLVNFSGIPISGIPVNFRNVPAPLSWLTRFRIDATHSNGYAVAQRIFDRMTQAEAQAKALAEERFALFLSRRGYSRAEVEVARNLYRKYIVNPNDPEVQKALDGLSARIRKDLTEAFEAAVAFGIAVYHQAAEEVNHWPEVALHAESQAVARSGADHAESVSLEPHSVQFLILSDRPIADRTLPSIQIQEPAEGALVSGSVLVRAGASDDTGVRMVEFHADGSLLEAKAAAPYTSLWRTASTYAGPHTLEAVVYDAFGNAARHRVQVTVGEAVGIHSLDPRFAIPGEKIVVSGWGFREDGNTVELRDSVSVPAQYISASTLTFTVPDAEPAIYDVAVANANGRSPPAKLLLKPDIRSEHCGRWTPQNNSYTVKPDPGPLPFDPFKAELATQKFLDTFWKKDIRYFSRKSTGTFGPAVFWIVPQLWEVLMDAYERTGRSDAEYLRLMTEVFDSQFEKRWGENHQKGHFQTGWFDDSSWWGLALVRMYSITKDNPQVSSAKYLQYAKELATHAVQEGWDRTLYINPAYPEGLWWNLAHEEKNAETNNYNAILLAKLAEIDPSGTLTPPGGLPRPYLELAKTLYDWGKFNERTFHNYLCDGISLINGRPVPVPGALSYNQGAFIGAAAMLYKLTQDTKYLEDARAVAESSIIPYFFLDETLEEYGMPGYLEGAIFKLALARYLLYLSDPGVLGDKADPKFRHFLSHMAHRVWDNTRRPDGLFGKDWTLKSPKAFDLSEFVFSETNGAAVGLLNLVSARGATALIRPEGGRLDALEEAGATVRVPPSAVSEPVNLKIAPEDGTNPQMWDLKRKDEERRGLLRVGTGVEITATGLETGLPVTRFSHPLEIALVFDPVKVLNPSEGGIFYWDEGRRTWQAILGAQWDMVRHRVSIRSDHLTTFAVFKVQSHIRNLAFGEVFAYPNPVEEGSVTFHVEAGTADSVEIRVYDLAGRLVDQLNLPGPAQIGINGRPAFERAWDLSRLASGVYYYAVRALQGGAAAHTLRKLAVLK